MKALDTTALVLVVVGGLNWLLIGLFEMDLVSSVFGEGSGLARAVFVLVGLAALWMLWGLLMNKSSHHTEATV